MRAWMLGVAGLTVTLLLAGCSGSSEPPVDAAGSDASAAADSPGDPCYDACLAKGVSAETCAMACSGSGVDGKDAEDAQDAKNAKDGEKGDPCIEECVAGGKDEAFCEDYCPYGPYLEAHGEACLEMGGYFRCWNKHVPERLGNTPALVVDLHGGGASPEYQRELAGWAGLADEEGFVVVWPYGLARTWNAGELCCDPASTDDVDDVGFLRKLIASVVTSDGVDPSRVYLSGHSNGCAMAQRFAGEASDAVAAVACMALYLLVEPAPGYTPVSVMEIHGSNDPVIGYGPGYFAGAIANFEKWATMNGCSGDPVETWREGERFLKGYSDCDDGTEVSLLTIEKVGHFPYGGKAGAIDSTRMAWDFVKGFTRTQ